MKLGRMAICFLGAGGRGAHAIISRGASSIVLYFESWGAL